MRSSVRAATRSVLCPSPRSCVRSLDHPLVRPFIHSPSDRLRGCATGCLFEIPPVVPACLAVSFVSRAGGCLVACLIVCMLACLVACLLASACARESASWFVTDLVTLVIAWLVI